MQKRNLKGLTLTELQDFAESIGEQRYRGKQLFEWLYRKRESDFTRMSSLSATIRARLASSATVDALRCVTRLTSHDDGTTKFLFELSDGRRIESVLIPPRTAFESSDARNEEEQRRLTLCVSTQVGCPLDCKFCATGTMGFSRNLTTGEIIDQLMQVSAITGRTVTNLVYMGMGEPLMNYENVMNSAAIISTAMGIAARRITISTAGWAPNIRRLADEQRKVKLAVSLHSLNDRSRTALMPVAKKFPLPELLDAVEYYYRETRMRVTFEYILFDGWNDTEKDIRLLIATAGRIPCKINIIPFHSIAFTSPEGVAAKLAPTPPARAEEFVRTLREAHLTVFVRSSAGEDIAAACGQLAVSEHRRRRHGTAARPRSSHSHQHA